MQRVKVYRLNSDGLWDDKGTGHVSVEYLEVGPCCLGSDAHQVYASRRAGLQNISA